MTLEETLDSEQDRHGGTVRYVDSVQLGDEVLVVLYDLVFPRHTQLRLVVVPAGAQRATASLLVRVKEES